MLASVAVVVNTLINVPVSRSADVRLAVGSVAALGDRLAVHGLPRPLAISVEGAPVRPVTVNYGPITSPSDATVAPPPVGGHGSADVSTAVIASTTAVGVFLVAAAIFFLLHRRRRQQQAMVQEVAMGSVSMVTGDVMAGVPTQKDKDRNANLNASLYEPSAPSLTTLPGPNAQVTVPVCFA
jgi:hypothetical protein